MHKEFLIEASDNSASGVKVWILTAMVVLLMAIVSFLTVRLINTVDETEAAVQASKEVQASQGEVIKGLQRDRDNTDKEIERLRNQVDRLKDDNAALKAKVGIPLTLNSEPPSGGFFVSAIWSGLLSESVPHNTQKLIRESPEPDYWFRSAGRTPAIKSNFYMAFLFFSAKNRSVNLGNSANDREMIHWR